MKKMVPSISFQIFLRQRINEDMFQLVSAGGFKRCELWTMEDHINYRDLSLARKIKGWAEKYDVLPSTAHLPIYAKGFRISLGDKEQGTKSLDEMMYALDFLHHYDTVSTFILHLSGDIEVFYNNFSKLYDNSDRRFAIENNPTDFPLVKDIIVVVNHLRREMRDGSRRIGACLDIGHANICERPPSEAVKALGNLIIATHISDNKGDFDSHLVPQEGDIEWKEVVEAFRSIGYPYDFTFEISPAYELQEIPKILERLKAFCEQNNITL